MARMTYPPPPPGQPPNGQPQYGQPHPEPPYGQPMYPPAEYAQPQPGPYGPQPMTYGYPLAPPPRLSEPVVGWLLLGAGALTMVAAALPWASVLGTSIAGTRGDGKISLFCGAVIAILGVLIGLRQGRVWVSITACVFAVFVALIGLADIGNVSSVADGSVTAILGDDAVTVGAGLWVTLVAGLAGIAVSIVGIARRPELTT